MITKYRERKVRGQLKALFYEATRRYSYCGPENRYRSFYDFLNVDEQREYTTLAQEHHRLCLKLGIRSAYYNIKRDYLKLEPNSPVAYLTVQNNTCHEATIWTSQSRFKDGRQREFLILDGELQYPKTSHTEFASVEDEEEIRRQFREWTESNNADN